MTESSKNKMIRFIDLTQIVVDVNDKGQEKLDRADLNFLPNQSKNSDEYGRDAEWYREAGLPVPEDLEDFTTINVTLDGDDYDYKYLNYSCNVECIEGLKEVDAIKGDRLVTLITTTSGDEITVAETIEQIKKLIDDGNK